MKVDLLPIKEFKKLGRTPRPYFYYFKAGDKFLYYLGVKHSHDIKSTNFNVIEHYFYDFLYNTQSDKVLAVVEGGVPPLQKSKKDAISKFGEVGFVNYIATKNKIKTTSPEPPQNFEQKKLLAKFSKDEIMSYYFVRQVVQYNRLPENTNYEDYIDKYLSEYKRDLGWKDYDFSLKGVEKTFEKITGTRLIRDDQYYLTLFDDPTETKYITNSVARECSNIRDKYILEMLVKYWNKGYSMFVVYGSYHAIVQQPALKKLLN